MTERRQRCILYLRQSLARVGETEDTSLSLDAQERRLREFAGIKGWLIADVHRDHDLKGEDPKRPGILNLLTAAENQTAEIVVVFGLSRFARDFVLQEMTFRELRRLGVQVVSLSEPNIEHTLFRGLLGVINQYASEQTGQFVSAAASQRIERGLTHGPPPFGYRKLDKRLVIDETEASLVRTIYGRWLAGDGVVAITERIDREPIRPRKRDTWIVPTVREMLRNPVYAGRAHILGNVRPGVHDAIIDPDDWDRAQSLWIRRPKVHHRDRPSWTEGLVEHSCGSRMYLIPTHKETETKDTFWQYICQRQALSERSRWCGQATPRIVLWRLEAAAKRALAIDLAQRYSIDEVIEAQRVNAGGAEAARALAAIRKKRETINARTKRAEDLYLNGIKEMAWLANQEAAARIDLAALDAEEAALPRPVDHAALSQLAAAIGDLADGIDYIPGEALRPILEQLGVIVVSDQGATIRYHPDPAWFFPAPVAVPFRSDWMRTQRAKARSN